jgi:thiamine biosynthesis protein ThiS
MASDLPEQITVTVNGQTQSVPAASTVGELLRGLPTVGMHVAVERNGELVPRECFDQQILRPADSIEVVTLVGGG